MPRGRLQFRPDAGAQGQRQAAQQRRHGGHHDRTEAANAGFIDRFCRSSACPFRLQREIDHHDGVLLHDSDEKNDADQSHDVELAVRQHQGQDRAHTGRRQRRKNGDGMDVAFIEHAQDQVDRDQCSENQQRLTGQGGLESRSRALKTGIDGGWKVD